ncbi:hypothetical protein DdX_11526 [Ditylenchus destructor]|uniref:Uncharacterized protein n=1 Tax=Ditylenchus destructor TaxID=166010 RepID=A0AAD4R4C1_9BILA|nr:hypothetical protein DdX_11526 [Ditylenchus destructor]
MNSRNMIPYQELSRCLQSKTLSSRNMNSRNMIPYQELSNTVWTMFAKQDFPYQELSSTVWTMFAKQDFKFKKHEFKKHDSISRVE